MSKTVVIKYGFDKNQVYIYGEIRYETINCFLKRH